ncbi:XAC2610-related protein [Ectopseudomonas guguanensis]|uniref:Nitrite reductase n=1 Tax=Ectopseudomonas guguanensis TaxID=1198456 RepID=A0A1H0K1X7_9GAMM|nr:nitrite reductase [Pseudomonas guguanensis]SDO50005.1 hypothetical protein SAMN05216213_101171 [Pseudomonas guguanensis]
MRSLRNSRVFLCSLTLILASLWPLAMRASAAQAPDGAVEFPVWSHAFVGTLGSKHVEVSLSRIADDLSGTYCYQPCNNQTRHQLVLQGRVRGDGAELIEHDRGNRAITTGVWTIESLDGSVTGTWGSPDGKRRLPLALRKAESADALQARFPYDVRLLADALPEQQGDGCRTPPLVSAIRLYKDGALFQTLETESQGTCSIFTPELLDANFDGWPDLSIAQFLPAGPNIPYQTWLYDPASARFVDAPATLQGITSADFDPEHQVVYSFWRASCCEHGVSIYRWKGGDLQEVDTQSSYLLPVMDGGVRRICYIAPGYNEGFIEYPGRVEQTADGRLRLHQIDPKTCEVDDWAFLQRTYIDIWKPALPGEKPVLLRSEGVTWIATDTTAGQRYCPEVPYFDSGRIRRVVLSDDPDWCTEERPSQE